MSVRRRGAAFAGVGIGVAAVGFAVLAALIAAGLDAHLAYLVQAVICVELNFVLNRRLTWRDRRTSAPALRQWLRFHTSRAAVVPGNQALFSSLTVAGVPFWGANAVCLGLASGLNFAIAHLWVFRRNGT